MSGAEKKLHADQARGEYVAEAAYLKWLEEVAGHTVPEWLTKAMLGRTTLTGPAVLFDKTKDALWRKYGETGRNIRSLLDSIVDTFTVENNDQTELPSGGQEPDLMQYIHERAWEQTDGNPKRMTMSDFEERLARGDKI